MKAFKWMEPGSIFLVTVVTALVMYLLAWAGGKPENIWSCYWGEAFLDFRGFSFLVLIIFISNCLRSIYSELVVKITWSALRRYDVEGVLSITPNESRKFSWETVTLFATSSLFCGAYAGLIFRATVDWKFRVAMLVLLFLPYIGALLVGLGIDKGVKSLSWRVHLLLIFIALCVLAFAPTPFFQKHILLDAVLCTKS